MAKREPTVATGQVLERRDAIRLAGFGLVMLVIVPIVAWWTPPFRSAHWRLQLNWAAFTRAPIATQTHAFAILTLIVGGWAVVALPKGDRRHRLLGRMWMIGMLTIAFAILAVPHGFSAVVAY